MVKKRLPAEERKKQILQCAIRVFAHRGYHGATTKRISEEAGVAEALLYRYFGSKRGLFTEAMQRTGNHLVQGLEQAFGDDADVVTSLQRIYKFYRHVLLTHDDLAKMIFLVAAELDDPEVREVYLPHQESALRIISKAVHRWQTTGALKKDIPARAVAWLFLSGYQVLALMKHSGRLEEFEPRIAFELIKPFFQE